jgi:hypothetical protein
MLFQGIFKMRSSLLFAWVIGVSFLAGCSPPVPIAAKIESTKEEFIGSADPMTGKISGVVYPSGATCSGLYKTHLVWDANSTYNLNGSISCSDGRAGTWNATGSNNIGRGVGTLGGKLMKISFGNIGIINSY